MSDTPNTEQSDQPAVDADTVEGDVNVHQGDTNTEQAQPDEASGPDEPAS